MFIPKKNDPFNVADWHMALFECQYLLFKVLHQKKADLAKAEYEYQTALQQHETRRARWFAKTIPVLRQQIADLEQSYRHAELLIESMANSMGLENSELKEALKHARLEARIGRVANAFWQAKAEELETFIQSLYHKQPKQ